jgi:diphthine synthase
MLYLIGLGLNNNSMSKEGLETVKRCKKIYLEGYTVDFPYTIKDLETEIERKIIVLGRDEVESERLIKEAKENDVCLLVYGSPLFATTHNSLLMDCRRDKIKFKVIYNASIFDAIAETGLQLYKFGKISSMAKWTDSFEPDSFLDIVKENISINAHSLILVDIGLEFDKALEQFKKAVDKRRIKINKLIICSNLGNGNSKIVYEDIANIRRLKINPPFCFIIPGKMHFLEQEFLNRC